MEQTAKEILTALFNYWWEGLARVGYGLGGILPPEEVHNESK